MQFFKPPKFEYRELTVIINAYDPTIHPSRGFGYDNDGDSLCGKTVTLIRYEFYRIYHQNISDAKKIRRFIAFLKQLKSNASNRSLQYSKSHASHCEAIRLYLMLRWMIEDIRNYGLKSV